MNVSITSAAFMLMYFLFSHAKTAHGKAAGKRFIIRMDIILFSADRFVYIITAPFCFFIITYPIGIVKYIFEKNFVLQGQRRIGI